MTDDPVQRLIEALAREPDADRSFHLFEGAVADFGFTSVDYYSGTYDRWPLPSAADWRVDEARATYEWQSDYVGTEFQKYDRAAPYAMRRSGPWLYWDVWDQPPENEVQRRMEQQVQAIVGSGMGIALHDPGNRWTGCHMGSNLTRGELAKIDGESRGTISLMGALFHTHMRSHTESPPAATPALSPRARECLLWAAQGKTAWETSVILGVSESLVKKYLAVAAAALGARSRTQAVALAIHVGLITL